ncbi:ankyrin and het domain-containing protein [Colletotrichum sojae]|uniref:Ankyrin and het domain-containing protein n=1 Tax=Colletotrichum sojae TaxID=2175907 RepID=A0A8H6J545_9PEZI|nr:ankyrin and het domain-containing protein [Colletotrichum sojae]
MNLTSAPVYQTTSPLGPNEFRLLHVHPAPSLTSPLVAHLSVARCDPGTGTSSTPYDALSYRWGDPGDLVTILVNGTQVGITRSLDSALRHLRTGEEVVVIWTDALYIAQSHRAERSAQIGLMGGIYRAARVVRMYLGEAGTNTSAAMRLVEECAGLGNEALVKERVLRDGDGAAGLVEVLGREYWTRVWMFQEVLLARRAVVHCGGYSAPWRGFKILERVADGNEELRAALRVVARFAVPAREVKDVESLVVATRGLGASVAAEKVYALAGLCDLEKYFEIEDMKTTREVYVEFARGVYRRHGLGLMAGAGRWDSRIGGDVGLPSWTPDFRGVFGVDLVLAAAAHVEVFDATKGRVFSGSSSSSGEGVLEVEGVIVDTVQINVTFGKGEEGRRRILESFNPRRLPRSPSGTTRLQAICDALVMNTDPDGRNKLPDGRSLNRLRLLGLIRQGEFLLGDEFPKAGDEPDVVSFLGSDAQVLKDVAEEYLGLCRSDPTSFDAYRDIFTRSFDGRASSSASLFTTESGYVGRGIRDVQPEDVVAVLFGSRTPVVLRSVGAGSKYMFVSACYVGGLMFGELMDQLDVEGARGVKVERLSLV